MKKLLILILLACSTGAMAQKVDSIYFNLYTDSLKKGVHNYINVVAKMSNGTFYPLMADELEFTSSAGKWLGNSLFLDSTYNKDSVLITTKLKANGNHTKSITIYMKKNLYEGPLKTEQELLEEWKKSGKRKS